MKSAGTANIGGLTETIRNVNNTGTIDTTASGTLEVNGDWTNNGSFVAATGTVKLTNKCAGVPLVHQLTGSSAFYNLDISGQGTTGFTVGLPSPKAITTSVNGALTFSNSGAPITITGPYCAGILVKSRLQLPSHVTLDAANAIWIGTQPPAQCSGGNPSQSAVPVPGLGAEGVGLLSLLLGGALAWGRRRARGGRRQA